MSALQKFAWYNLAILALTLAVVLSLMPFLGKRAVGGFGLSGFLGLGVLFFRKKPGQVLTDERDLLIQRRSWTLAFVSSWVIFGPAASTLSAVVYGQEGAIPVYVVQNSVWCAFMFVYALGSIAILVQYARGSQDAK